MVEVKKFHGVAFWAWNIDVDNWRNLQKPHYGPLHWVPSTERQHKTVYVLQVSAVTPFIFIVCNAG